ncbi:hypothetical protein [Variovorax saccharolyticus]|uniref:hypothetical protein n=1 Tax=Variovorax saccharolyticus TaxID=3053516 RepID=UPI002577D536|nr:hypothetical protein [Variovorax sp. J31P216]MDM0029853.1 hypothetical protein [Variovorax sp. J31P216]
MDKNIEGLRADERLALLGGLMDDVSDREMRAAILRDIVSIVKTAGASASEFAELAE